MLFQIDHVSSQCFLMCLLTLVLCCHIHLLLYIHVIFILFCFFSGSFYPKHISMSVDPTSMGSYLSGHALCLLHTYIVQTTSLH